MFHHSNKYFEGRLHGYRLDSSLTFSDLQKVQRGCESRHQRTGRGFISVWLQDTTLSKSNFSQAHSVSEYVQVTTTAIRGEIWKRKERKERKHLREMLETRWQQNIPITHKTSWGNHLFFSLRLSFTFYFRSSFDLCLLSLKLLSFSWRSGCCAFLFSNVNFIMMAKIKHCRL